MKYLLLSISIILAAFSLKAQVPVITLDDAVNYALENSSEVRQAMLDIQDADGRISETLSTGIPKINGNVQYQYFPDVPNFLIPAQFTDPDAPDGSFISLPAGTRQSLSANLELNALIFDGSFFVGLRAAEVFKDLTQKEGDLTIHELRWRVKRAFYSALLVKEQLGELEGNLKNVEQLLRETRILYEEGFAELLDVRRLELTLSNLESNLNQLSRMDTLTENLLKFQMGWPQDEEFSLSGDLTEKVNLDLINKPELEYEYSDRPDYRVLQVTEELNEMNIRQIRMGYLPKVFGFASHSQNLQRRNLFDDSEIGWLKTTAVGATLSVPIFDGLEKRAQMQRARISKEKVHEGQRQLRQAIQMEVRNNYLQYQNAIKTLNDYEKQMDLSNEIYETVLIRYREGLASSFELIQAEQDMFDARIQYLNGQYELLDSRAKLDESLGK